MRIAPNRILIVLALSFLSLASFAAPGNPPPPTPPPPPGLSLDGGLLLFYVLTIIFGLYKIHQFNSNKKSSN